MTTIYLRFGDPYWNFVPNLDAALIARCRIHCIISKRLHHACLRTDVVEWLAEHEIEWLLTSPPDADIFLSSAVHLHLVFENDDDAVLFGLKWL
jgi:hypothetical protein